MKSGLLTASEYHFELKNGTITRFAQLDGAITGILSPKQTAIVDMEPTNLGIVVLEDYLGYTGTNLYLVDYNLRPAWEAELPEALDSFTGPLLKIDGGIVCSTWRGWRCELSDNSGRIVTKRFTK